MLDKRKIFIYGLTFWIKRSREPSQCQRRLPNVAICSGKFKSDKKLPRVYHIYSLFVLISNCIQKSDFPNIIRSCNECCNFEMDIPSKQYKLYFPISDKYPKTNTKIVQLHQSIVIFLESNI